MSRIEELKAEVNAELLKASHRTDAVLDYFEKKLVAEGKEPLSEETDIFGAMFGAMFGEVDLEVLIVHNMRQAQGMYQEALEEFKSLDLTEEQLEAVVADLRQKRQESDDELHQKYSITFNDDGTMSVLNDVVVISVPK